MNGIAASNFLQALGWAVVNSLWQMALLWILFQLITSVFKIKKPSQKSALATVLLISGFTWFVYTFFIIWRSSITYSSPVTSFISYEGNERLNTWLHKSLPIASLIYLTLLILPVIQFTRNFRYVRLIRRYGLDKADVQWRMFVKKVAGQMGMTKPVHIWLSEWVSSPVTIGFLKPIILVPMAAVNHLSTQQLEAVLLHELAHIRRNDYLINLILNLVRTVLYFNPFVKAFIKTVDRERERSCDEMVMQFQYDPHGYATALLILEKNHRFHRTLAVAASGNKYDLLQRIELILGIRKKPVLSFHRLAGLFAGLLCVIVLNVLLIVSKPSTTNRHSSFTHLSAPFLYLTGDKEAPAGVFAKNETSSTPIKSTSTASPVHSTLTTQPVNEEINATTPLYMYVKYEHPAEIPTLRKDQETQVKEAMNLSKRVIQEAEWKELEKNIADALTSGEKAKIKSAYEEEFSKMNWQQWENKLRLSYDEVDWNRINDQLGRAVLDIKIDSLQKVYSNVVIDLHNLHRQLKEQKVNGIPDTDITPQAIEKKIELAQRMVNKLKAARNKKIIHL
jgi:beta-lactamase regulating signal transducer with metallopeptidase domain